MLTCLGGWTKRPKILDGKYIYKPSLQCGSVSLHRNRMNEIPSHLQNKI